MLTWYLPSFYGDIRLEQVQTNQTKVTIYGLTSAEKLAMMVLLREAEKDRVVGPCWNPLASRLLDLDSIKEQSLELKAPISKVQKILKNQLKPGRDQVSVVRFGGGKMQEMTERHLQALETDTPAADGPPARGAITAATSTTNTAEPQLAATGTDDTKPAVAATIARPVRGCPPPDFEQAEIRAEQVMSAFLTAEQLSDFKSDQAFVSTGADTGHKYIITSRHARTVLAETTRSLFDLDEQTPYCVHDWDVPAAEEMLALHVFLSIPGLETYLRGIPHG
jgi:hypothetical protein